ELQVAALHLLQRGGRGDHLGHRGDAEHRVRADRVVLPDRPRAGGPLVDHPVPVGGDGCDVRYVTRVYRGGQDLVDGGCGHSFCLLARALPTVTCPTLARGGPTVNNDALGEKGPCRSTWRRTRCKAVGMSLGSVLTAIVTPFDDKLAVDEQAFVNLLHH